MELQDTRQNSSMHWISGEAARPVCRVVGFFSFRFSLYDSRQEKDHLAQIPDILAAVTISRLNNVVILP